MICIFCHNIMPVDQKLDDKYKRALKSLSQACNAIEDLELANQQLRDDIQNIDQTFEMFKKQSIRQYSILRDQIETINNQRQTSDTGGLVNAGQYQKILELNKQIHDVKQEYGSLCRQMQRKNIELSNMQESYRQKQALLLIRLKQAQTGRENLREYISQIQCKGHSQSEGLRHLYNKLEQDLTVASNQVQFLLKQKEELKYELRKQLIEISSLRQFLFKILSTQSSAKVNSNYEFNNIFKQINSYFRQNI